MISDRSLARYQNADFLADFALAVESNLASLSYLNDLADVFISAVRAYEHGRPRNVQLIIETHSEHFLNRLQRRIAEEKVTPKEVAIYFAKTGSAWADLEELTVNEYGDITNWPDNFFGDEMGDIVARTEAAAARRAGAR